jgi:hypothetical protein
MSLPVGRQPRVSGDGSAHSPAKQGLVRVLYTWIRWPLAAATHPGPSRLGALTKVKRAHFALAPLSETGQAVAGKRQSARFASQVQRRQSRLTSPPYFPMREYPRLATLEE